MTHTSAFKTPEGEAAYFAAYDAAMALWPVPYEEIDIPTRFGLTHVVACGPKNAPPLVLLHGMLATLTMWSPNVAALSKDYRVYAVDVMGQPGGSIPDRDHPIRNEADYVAWLGKVLDGLKLERILLAGMSYGGWISLAFSVANPTRIRKLVLLSPASSFRPHTRQFTLRMLPMAIFPSPRTVNGLFGWMGFTANACGTDSGVILDLAYLGLKHFRMPLETAGDKSRVFSDEELRGLHVPVLLLIGEGEVIYDPAKAFARASRLIPDFDGELIPGCRHEMCISQRGIVNARVLDFLHDSRGSRSGHLAQRTREAV